MASFRTSAEEAVHTSTIIIPILVAFALAACQDAPEYAPLNIDSPVCGGGSCAIVLDTLASMGAPEDTIWPSLISRAVRLPDGRFIVGGTDHAPAVVVYSSTGRFLYSFGAPGSGPGEFSSGYQVPIVGPGDTLNIVDILGSRRTLLSDSGEYYRSHTIPQTFHDLFFMHGRTFVQADVRASDRVGHLVHELDDAGGIVQSFAELSLYRGEADGYAGVAVSPAGGVWLTTLTQYKLTHFDENFTPRQVIQFDLPWFPPNRGNSHDLTQERPVPVLNGVWQAPDSIVWTLMWLPDPRWRPTGPQPRTIGNIIRRFDARLEAVDPRSGQRLASMNFDGLVRFGSGDGVLYELTEGPEGRGVLTAYALTLTGRRNQ